MKNLFNAGLKSVTSLADKTMGEVAQKFSLVKDVVNGIPFFVSSEKTSKYGEIQYDERHYFVVPFMLDGGNNIALHSMRCLPEGVPEINKLPKRRVFHFPNEHTEVLVQQMLVDSAKDLAEQEHECDGNTLTRLANDIDALDKKLTYGMLFVGGMAAFVNPVVGVGIAAKALMPGVAGMLNKYGLRPAGEKLSQAQLEKKVKEAEAGVLKDFADASTIQVINPILQELELALQTTEKEHDPLLDFDMSKGSIDKLDGERWRELTETAIYHLYKEVLEDPSKYADACLGPEDIRWLKVILSNKSGC
ncbi:hypothetical protein ACFL2V_09490 [Pseudomonadota bacterium]